MNKDNYAKHYTAHYERSFTFEAALVDLRREYVLKSLHKYQHRHILEIGCGLSPLFPHCANFDTFTVVEPVTHFVEHARELAGTAPNITIIEGFLESVSSRPPSLSNQKFDFVVLSSLLHEVADPGALLDATHELCDPQGILHINVPNVYSFHRLIALEMGLISDLFEQSEVEKRFQRHTRFDKHRLLEMIRAHGFRVLHFATYLIKPFTHDQMERIVTNGIADRAIIKALDRMTKYFPEAGCEMYVEVQPETL